MPHFLCIFYCKFAQAILYGLHTWLSWLGGTWPSDETVLLLHRGQLPPVHHHTRLTLLIKDVLGMKWSAFVEIPALRVLRVLRVPS